MHHQLSSDITSPASVAVGGELLEVGRSATADVRLLHATISRRHATLKRSGNVLVVTDLDSRYGTFVNGVQVRTAEARLGDRIQFGASLVYRVVATGLELDRQARGVELEAEGIAVCRSGRVIVSGLSFAIAADAFVGILGPSGAGKSTLLNCLASQSVPSAGQLRFDDGREVNSHCEAYRSLLGHVTQEDLLFGLLSARENLEYAAQLRATPRQDGDGTRGSVARALERVGLAEHADKPAAVLSGGQRKRLSVALELLRQPRLLLLDEPTAGLDPASEAHLMEQLRHIARQGTTIICNTHLMDNLRLFDTVIVLGLQKGTGRLAYVGPPAGLLDHFTCRNFADLYEKLAAGQFVPCTAASETPARPPVVDKPPAMFPEVQAHPLAWLAQKCTAELRAGLKRWDRQQFQTVYQRELRLLGRDRMLWQMMLAQPVVLGMLVCLTQYSPFRATAMYCFSVVLAIWLGLNNSARDLVRQRKQYVRDRLAGLLPENYLGAKLALFGSIGLVQITLLLLVLLVGSRLVQGERQPDELQALSRMFWLMVLFVAYLGGLGIGFLVSILVRTEESAVAALPLLIIPQLLLSVVAIGEADARYDQNRPLRPLVVTLHTPGTASSGPSQLGGWAMLVDFVSLPLYSRPATLALDSHVSRVPPGYVSWSWLLDVIHLLLLVGLTWLVVYFAFLLAEQRWPRLVGY